MEIQEKNMVIASFAKDREDILIATYIADGPVALKEQLEVSEEQWVVVFDYLVFEHNLLYKTVAQSVDFFHEQYVKHGMAQVREILNVLDDRYDEVCEMIFDFLAISRDGLYFHVLENRDRYMVAFKARGGDFVRKVLGVWKSKYEESWLKVLDVLLHAVCDAIFTENTFEHGLKAFSLITNGMREHRPLEKSERFRVL